MWKYDPVCLKSLKIDTALGNNNSSYQKYLQQNYIWLPLAASDNVSSGVSLHYTLFGPILCVQKSDLQQDFSGDSSN